MGGLICIYATKPMSGNIAQLTALRHPNRLRSLILVRTTPTDARVRGLNAEDVFDYSQNPIDNYQMEFQNIYNGLTLGSNLSELYLKVLD